MEQEEEYVVQEGLARKTGGPLSAARALAARQVPGGGLRWRRPALITLVGWGR